MHIPKGPWGSPQVEDLLQSHMQQYAKAGIIAGYLARSREWLELYNSFNDPDSGGFTEDLAAARRSEHWLFPSIMRNQGLSDRLMLQKVDSATGIILPSSSESLAVIDEDQLRPRSHFENCDLTIVLNAIVDVQDLELQATDASGTNTY